MNGIMRVAMMMRLARLFAVGALAMLLSRPASAQDQDFSKVQIKVTKVSGNIYMLEGAGGNIAASASLSSTTSSRRWRRESRRR